MQRRTPSTLRGARVPKADGANLRELCAVGLDDGCGDDLLIPDAARRRVLAGQLRVALEERERRELARSPGGPDADHQDGKGGGQELNWSRTMRRAAGCSRRPVVRRDLVSLKLPPLTRDGVERACRVGYTQELD